MLWLTDGFGGGVQAPATIMNTMPRQAAGSAAVPRRLRLVGHESLPGGPFEVQPRAAPGVATNSGGCGSGTAT